MLNKSFPREYENLKLGILLNYLHTQCYIRH